MICYAQKAGRGEKHMKIEQLTDWKLAGYWPYAPLQSESMETGMTLIPQTPWIDAKVPGSVQNDLLAAGLIEDQMCIRDSRIIFDIAVRKIRAGNAVRQYGRMDVGIIIIDDLRIACNLAVLDRV